MANQLIGSIKVVPATARPGEPIEVTVLRPDGQPVAASANVNINGIEGNPRTLQYRSRGTRTLRVRAAAGGVDEEMVATVEVAGEPVTFTVGTGAGTSKRPALLQVRQDLEDPYRVTFFLGDPQPSKVPDVAMTKGTAYEIPVGQGALARAGPARLLPSKILAKAPEGKVLVSNIRPARNGPKNLVMQAAFIDLGVAKEGASDAMPETRFDWDFGDGKKATTTSAQITHDFLPAVGAGQARHAFLVRCRAVRDDVTVSRTLVLYAAYGLCKAYGTLSPPVRASPSCSRWGNYYTAALSVTNLEKVPLQVTHRAIVPHFDNPDDLAVPQFSPMALVLAPESTTALTAYASMDDDVPRGATGFSLLYAGKTADGGKVRFSAAYDIPIALRRPTKSLVLSIQPPVLMRKVWPWEQVQQVAEKLKHAIPTGGKPVTVAVESKAGVLAISVPRSAVTDPRVEQVMHDVGRAAATASGRTATIAQRRGTR